MLQFSKDIHDALAPGLYDLTECQPPELPPRSSAMLPALLSAHLCVQWKPGKLRIITTLIRRAEHAAFEYRAGRDALLDYLADKARGNDRLGLFARALCHFEQSVAQAYLAAMLVMEFAGERLFVKGDGSETERLNALFTHIKHFNSKIRINNPLYTEEHVSAPMWVTADGLACHEAQLRWGEMLEVLEELARCAQVLASPAEATGRPAPP